MTVDYVSLNRRFPVLAAYGSYLIWADKPSDT